MKAAREKLQDYAARTLVGVKGAEKFAVAVARGDVVGWALWRRRKAICHSCKSRVRVTINGTGTKSDFCGQPFVDNRKNDPPTCGCLLYAKTLVKSERCDQGRW